MLTTKAVLFSTAHAIPFFIDLDAWINGEPDEIVEPPDYF